MTRRVLIGYLAITVVVLLILEIPLALVYGDRERAGLIADGERDATVLASYVEDVLDPGNRPDPDGMGSATEAVRAYADDTGTRVVVTGLRGRSVIDTDDRVGRDFSTRPEVADALRGTRATGVRPSDTLGHDLLYVAVPVASGGIVHGVLRLTVDAHEIDVRVHRVWIGLALVGIVVVLAVGVVGWAVAGSVTRPLRSLERTAARLADGDLSARAATEEGPPELVSLSQTMSVMAERLEEQLAAQRRFVGDASHQLRSPLTGLRLRLENLEAVVPDGDRPEVEAALAETARLSTLVDDLLRLARTDRETPLVTVRLDEVVAQRVETWSAVAESLGMELRAEVEPSAPVTIIASAGAVEQVLDNLVDNALTAGASGSVVEVDLVVVADEVEVRVTDRGPGLSDEDKARAVQRFWRGSASGAGSGLGLPIAVGLVARANGRLELRDRPGGGLVAVVVLPIRQG